MQKIHANSPLCRLLILTVVVVVSSVWFGISCRHKVVVPKDTIVNVISKKEVFVDGRHYTIPELNECKLFLREDLLKAQVVFSGGEECSEGDFFKILGHFWVFQTKSFLLDGNVVRVCTGEPSNRLGWWYAGMPEKTVLVTAFEAKYDLLECGVLADEYAAQVELARLSSGHKELLWKYKASPRLSFADLKKELVARLSGNNISVYICSFPSAQHKDILDIIRICREYNLKYIFLGWY